MLGYKSHRQQQAPASRAWINPRESTMTKPTISLKMNMNMNTTLLAGGTADNRHGPHIGTGLSGLSAGPSRRC